MCSYLKAAAVTHALSSYIFIWFCLSYNSHPHCSCFPTESIRSLQSDMLPYGHLQLQKLSSSDQTHSWSLPPFPAISGFPKVNYFCCFSLSVYFPVRNPREKCHPGKQDAMLIRLLQDFFLAVSHIPLWALSLTSTNTQKSDIFYRNHVSFLLHSHSPLCTVLALPSLPP